MANKGVLLVNFGGPISGSPPDINRFIKTLKNRSYPEGKFRNKITSLIKSKGKNTKYYQSVYSKYKSENGSLMHFYTRLMVKMIKDKISMPIDYAMLHGSPGIAETLNSMLEEDEIRDFLIIPLFPHYSVNTFKRISNEIESLGKVLDYEITKPFYSDDNYINSLAHSMKEHILNEDWEHLIFAFDGISEADLKSADKSTKNYCLKQNCCINNSSSLKTCYKKQALKTSDLLSDYFNIPMAKYSYSFLKGIDNTNELLPRFEDEVQRLAMIGVENLLVLCPTYVNEKADIIYETRKMGNELFLKSGGEKYQVINCLNTNELWIDNLIGIVINFQKKLIANY